MTMDRGEATARAKELKSKARAITDEELWGLYLAERAAWLDFQAASAGSAKAAIKLAKQNWNQTTRALLLAGGTPERIHAMLTRDHPNRPDHKQLAILRRSHRDLESAYRSAQTAIDRQGWAVENETEPPHLDDHGLWHIALQLVPLDVHGVPYGVGVPGTRRRVHRQERWKMTTKISNLTSANVAALREIGAEDEGVQFGETYAIFGSSAQDALIWLYAQMDALDNRTAHPYASLHAVVRKLQAQALQSERGVVETTFRPGPGEQFQVLRGLDLDDVVFRVIEYAPMTSAPELIQRRYSLPDLPTEEVHCFRLDSQRVIGKDRKIAGLSFTTLPTGVMIPVGSTRSTATATAAHVAAGAAHAHAGPRRSSSGSGRGRASTGACEHCGAPTKGGRFVPGHDAKLKGDLIREAQSDDVAIRIPALIESAIRAEDNAKWAIEPAPSDAKALAQAAPADPAAFLAARIAARSIT